VSVPPEDPDAFCAALTDLLDDPARRTAMGESGRAFVEGWVSPAAVGASYETLFEQVRRERWQRRA